jgi:hypothetical protein
MAKVDPKAAAKAAAMTVMARLTLLALGSARRSQAAPLGLVLGCSAAAAALRRTRRALGTDASVRALASVSG